MQRLFLTAVVIIIAGMVQAGAATAAQVGKASYYCCSFAGKLTANGERFNPNAMTAAHKTLPFGSLVRVVHTKTGRSVVVRINDRGPYAGGRIIDLSKGAAAKLGFVNSGVASVRIEVIGMGKGARNKKAGKKKGGSGGDVQVAVATSSSAKSSGFGKKGVGTR